MKFPPKIPIPFKRTPHKKTLPPFCGLDIGSHSVKWVEIQEVGGKVELTGLGYSAIRREKSREGTLSAIKGALQGSAAGPRQVYTAISGHSVIIRYGQFPKMTLDELRSHVEVESDKYIPFNVKDVILDCHILEEKKEEGKILGLVVAVKKEIVSQHLLMVREAGLEPVCIDVDTFAMVNAFEHFLGGNSPSLCQALLDIGAKTTNVSILRGTTSLFSRDIPIGGTDLTQAISEKLKLEMDEAEMVKCGGERTKEELLSLVEFPLERLLGEVRLSFDYFGNQYDQRIERIYLSGGSSRFPGISEAIQKEFTIESLSWDPVAGIAISSKQILSKIRGIREGLAIAVGLALRGTA